MITHRVVINLVTDMYDPVRIIFRFYGFEELKGVWVLVGAVSIANDKDSSIGHPVCLCGAGLGGRYMHWICALAYPYPIAKYATSACEAKIAINATAIVRAVLILSIDPLPPIVYHSMWDEIVHLYVLLVLFVEVRCEN